MMRDYANGVDWTEENNSKAKRFLRLIPQDFRASDENIINRMNNTLRYLKQHFPELKNAVKEGDTKKSSNTVTHDINGTKVTVTKNSDGSYTLEANGKKVKSDDPSFFVNGTNLKPRVKAALAKEVGLETKKPILSQNDKTSIRSIVKKMFPRSNVSFSTKDELIVEVEGKAYGDSYGVWKEWKLKDGEPTEGGYSGDTSKSRIDELMKKLGKENLKKLKRISLKESYD